MRAIEMYLSTIHATAVAQKMASAREKKKPLCIEMEAAVKSKTALPNSIQPTFTRQPLRPVGGGELGGVSGFDIAPLRTFPMF
jgi:hypothetical protein